MALDADALESQLPSRARLLARLRYRTGWYDPAVLDALQRIVRDEMSDAESTVFVRDLRCGMILDEDVRTLTGVVLLRKEVEMSDLFLQRLCGLSANAALREPVRVLSALPPPRDPP